jgi:glycerol kinase
MAILAIDQGTSGTKVLIVGSDGHVLARGFALVELVRLAGGGVECVAEQLWQSVVDAANMAFSNWPSKGEIIQAVALANQGESILAWDVDSTEALSPVIIWQDARSASLCEDRKEKLDMVRARTGLTLDPYFVAPKMAWLRANVTRGGVVTTSDAWLIARLTGAFATDVTTACRSLAFDLQRQCWDSELLAMWGLESEQLPSIVANDVVVGTVGHSELRFLRDVPLAGVIVDQPAALFAQTCLDPGQAKCTYGTGAFLLANIGPMMRLSNHGLVTSIAWTVQGTTAHYFDGQVFTAGSAVQWLIDNGLLVSADEIDALPRDTRGVIACPGFAGYGAPRWQPRGTASISGLSLLSTREEMARAVVDGVAAQVAELIEAMGSDSLPLQRLRVDGGLTQSATLMQAQSDLAQLPIDVYPHPDATAIGAAAMARLALEPGLRATDAIPSWKAHRTFEPQWSAARAQDYLGKWREVAAHSLIATDG